VCVCVCVCTRRVCVRARDRVGKRGPLGAWRLPGGPSLAWVSCLPKGPCADPDGESSPLLEPTSAGHISMWIMSEICKKYRRKCLEFKSFIIQI